MARDADSVPRPLARALDVLNFLLADVRDGLGPYLSVYLLLTHHWDQASIGLVMAVGGIAAIVAQAPAGAWVDRTTAKRALLVGGALTITAGSLAMPLFPGLYSISVLQALTGIAGSVIAPALAAITLGVVGPRLFPRRIGRNESFNHAGNASAAAITGGLAYFFGPAAAFWVLAAMAVGSVVAALRFPGDAIDHDLARGMDHARGEPHRQPSRITVLLHNRRLMVFAATVVAFHFANAAMLPLVGQLLALRNKDIGTALMAVCIVAAQIVMVPVAYVAGAKADSWGRKPIFLAAFAVLAARGFLYPLSGNPLLAGRRAAARRCGSRRVRCVVSPRRAGRDARQRPVQRQPGRGHRRDGDRGFGVEPCRGCDRGRRGLRRGIRRTGGSRRRRLPVVSGRDARNGARGAEGIGRRK